MAGLETALAELAVSAVIRAISPAKQYLSMSIERRTLHREIEQAPSFGEIGAFLESVSPEVANDLTVFLSSAEMRNLAFNLATENVLGRCGNRSNYFSRELKAQLKALLALHTTILPAQLDGATEAIFAAMAIAVEKNVATFLRGEKPFSKVTKASILKLQDSLIASAIRNSEMLAGISSVTEFTTFEKEINLQVRNLYGTMRLPHAGAIRRVPYDKLYVQPTVELIKPTEEGDAPSVRQLRSNQPLTIETLASRILRIVLLGDPGGGKSTLALKLTYDCASGRGITGSSVPFLIVLREYAAELSKRTISLVEYIDQVCRTPLGLTPPAGGLEYLLLNGRAFVIFDGLDELLDTALRRQVVDAVSGFAHRYPSISILVTSRRVGYTDAPLDPDLFTAVNLGEFATNQVHQYVQKWFDLDEEETAARRDDLRRSFIEDSELVSDLRVNPLMLSLMCGIYASEHYIPRNRPDVYEKCALLLFDTWDKQRGIKPALSFDAHVQAAMRSLALWLYPQQLSRQGLPRAALIEHMKDYLLKKRFDNDEDAENAAVEFVDFCKGRAWVLTDVGAELYGFTHRTFLEYFAASQIVRENTDPTRLFNYLIERLRSGGWEVVAQLSLQMLNKAVEDGADDFLDILLSYVKNSEDQRLKFKLMAFATQSLAYVVPRPSVLLSLTSLVLELFCSQPKASAKFVRVKNADGVGTLIHLLLGAAPENLPLIAKYAFDDLDSRLRGEDANLQALSLVLYPHFHVALNSLRSDYKVSNNNFSFWQKSQEDVFPRFRGAAERMKKKRSWVEICLLERGLCSVSDVLADFGPAAFYESMHGKGIDIPVFPLAARVILSSLSLKVVGGATDITGESVEELKEALLRHRTPWFRAKQQMVLGQEILFLALERVDLTSDSGDDRMSLSAFLLLAAGLADVSQVFARSGMWISELGAAAAASLGGAVASDGPSIKSALLRRLIVTRLLLIDEFRERLSDERVDDLRSLAVSRRDLLEAGVDAMTAGVLDPWLSDATFVFIDGFDRRHGWRFRG